MKTILKYWYLIVLAFILSLGSATGLIYLRKDSWVPPEPQGEAPIALEEGDSRSFREWRFRANQLEGLKLQLDARQADLAREEKTMDLLRSQIETERAELIKIRTSLEELRAAIEADYISIAAQELANLQRLASIYSEVAAEATVKVFEGLEDETVVKILSLMQAESSARILGTMGESADPETLKRAAKFTADLRKVKQ